MPIRRKTKPVPDIELEALLKRYEEGTSVSNGRIQFHHLDSDELERILPDAFEADPSFTPRQLRFLLRKALLNCRRQGGLTIDGLVSEAHRLAKNQIAKPEQSYAMWTKFRAKRMSFFSGFRLNWDGVTLESAKHLPRYMVVEEYLLSGHGRIYPRRPEFFGYLITRCNAREEENAVTRMLKATEIFMAVFNMYEMWGRWSHGAERWADGKLWNGPHHFVFRGKRFLGHDRIWYDPNYDEEAWKSFPIDMPELLDVIPRTRGALHRLSGHPLRTLLVDVLRLMQEAMSTRDQNYSLLRYWSALEQLYGEPHGREKNYSRIIQRAAFAEYDKELARWKLAHISRMRNGYVHAGDSDDDLRVMTQYLRMLLSRHVNALLFGNEHVRSHAHWLEIVDLPDNEALLEERKAVIDQRLAIIRRSRAVAHEGSE
jgi:hypothetical protein